MSSTLCICVRKKQRSSHLNSLSFPLNNLLKSTRIVHKPIVSDGVDLSTAEAGD